MVNNAVGKTILVISPTPSHPQDAGNRARIYTLLLNLKNRGHDVHFVHIKRETLADELAMQQCWEGKFYSIAYQKPKPQNSQVNIFPAKLNTLNRIINKIQIKINSLNSNNRYTYEIDDWYDDSVNAKLIEISQSIKPDVVMLEYVFFSKALECFDSKILKVIDTHDIFANRHEIYLKNNQTPKWFSTTTRQENLGLKRADVILAIQNQEADCFKKRVGKTRKIVTVNHIVTLSRKQHRNSNVSQILFLASKNPININGISFFIQEVLPKVQTELPNAKLILAGSICEVMDENPTHYTKIGKVEDLGEAYQEADVVINPVFFGTGLKIKNIEALGYSMPLVTTPVGAEGMEEGAGKAFRVAESSEQFANEIVEIVTKPELYKKLSNNAYEFARQWNESAIAALDKAISQKK